VRQSAPPEASNQFLSHLNQEVNMCVMVNHLDSTKLVPFKKRRNGYHLPGLAKEYEEQIIDQVDPELRPDEQGYVRHYLAYADIMLRKAESGQRDAEQQSRDSPDQNRDQDKVQETSSEQRHVPDKAA
jgi:hypothetical protein